LSVYDNLKQAKNKRRLFAYGNDFSTCTFGTDVYMNADTTFCRTIEKVRDLVFRHMSTVQNTS